MGTVRIPSGEIEQLITGEIHNLLRHPSRVSASLAACLDTTSDLQRALRGAADLATRWPELTVPQLRPSLSQIIGRIDVHRDHVALHLSPTGLAAELLGSWQQRPQTMKTADEEDG